MSKSETVRLRAEPHMVKALAVIAAEKSSNKSQVVREIVHGHLISVDPIYKRDHEDQLNQKKKKIREPDQRPIEISRKSA